MAFIEHGNLSVVLNYGEQCDWVRNVLAARHSRRRLPRQALRPQQPTGRTT